LKSIVEFELKGGKYRVKSEYTFDKGKYNKKQKLSEQVDSQIPQVRSVDSKGKQPPGADTLSNVCSTQITFADESLNKKEVSKQDKLEEENVSQWTQRQGEYNSHCREDIEKLTFYLRNPGIEKTTPFMKV